MDDVPQTKEQMLKFQERRARRSVAERAAGYYHSLLNVLEDDAEHFFDRVMQRLVRFPTITEQI